jgi:fatty acid CoA ligase FadD9
MTSPPAPTGELDKRMERRLARLQAEDPQFRDAAPLEAVEAAKRQPGLRLAPIVATVMERYAERPALGHRARELVTDPTTGRRTLRLLPRFETTTYRELWGRAHMVASDWHHDGQHPLRAGDFVCILGFTSTDYTTLVLACIHLGAVVVPLQTSAPAAQHVEIIAETHPRILAASIDYLDSAIDAVLAGTAPQRVVVFDFEPQDDDQRDKFNAACRRLADAHCQTVVDTLNVVRDRARSLPAAPLYVPDADEDPLAWLFYTSGATGTPKGAMFTERLCVSTWLTPSQTPLITLSFTPMSHLVGNGYLLLTLANGGTSYCAPKSDLSTLFDDLSLVRPTSMSLVPRVCEMLYHHYLSEVDQRLIGGGDPGTIEDDVKTEMRENLLGGRLLSVGCGSASLAPEIYEFMESMLDMHMPIGYSSTEIAGATVVVDDKVQRPPVIDYRLDDVPELGYFGTDKPYPRGELLVKTDWFMAGYYKRPDLTAEKLDHDGFYKTGDIMAEIGPDRLVFVDRRNNVLKLSQGEFVAISRLEALYSHSPVIRQIYIYGSSERSFLLAVVVPTQELVARLGRDDGGDHVKSAISRSLQQIAKENHLNGYEVPRDLLIESEPFSLENGLLSGIGKFLRPKLRERYGQRLEQLYARIAQDQINELRALRMGGTDRPVLETVTRAAGAELGVSPADVRPDARFIDLGGDSLSALTFSMALEDIFHFEVPVGVIINPAGNLQHVADYIQAQRHSGVRRPSFASVHGADTTNVYARDLTLDKFIDPQILANASNLARPSDDIGTVLLTGATGYLGRFLALAWLQRLADSGGRLICITRGSDPARARQRIESALDTDSELIQRFRALAADHLEVQAGDISLSNLGVDQSTWSRLADTVDLIVHPAAHVNHVLPYNQLFAANVAGTAELIRLAITSKLKRVDYISSLGVNAVADHIVDEDSDIRSSVPACQIDDSYANGYGISKWASECLMRHTVDLCDLPVAVFRPGMILAHSRYAGQLNVPDMFTRLLFSLVTTGIAPSTFYAHNATAGRPRARYDGLPVDFLAEAIAAVGAQSAEGFHTYNLTSRHDEAFSLDTFVDWLTDTGYPIERIDDYDNWLSRFETALHALPEKQQQASVLAVLEPYRRPQKPVAKPAVPADKFQAAVQTAGFEIPHLTAALIKKYITDLQHLHLLARNEPAQLP